MRLILVRHAIAEERDPERWPDDSQRPLTRRGVRRFRSAARGLGALEPHVDLLLTSPWLRARQTATLLHEQAHWPEPEQRPHLQGGAPAAGVFSMLSQLPGGATVALVGHEPDLSELLNALISTSTQPSQFDWRKGGAALVDAPGHPTRGAAGLRWFLPPRLLRELED